MRVIAGEALCMVVSWSTTQQQDASVRLMVDVKQDFLPVRQGVQLALMPVMAQQISSESGGVSKKSVGLSTLAGKSR